MYETDFYDRMCIISLIYVNVLVCELIQMFTTNIQDWSTKIKSILRVCILLYYIYEIQAIRAPYRIIM